RPSAPWGDTARAKLASSNRSLAEHARAAAWHRRLGRGAPTSPGWADASCDRARGAGRVRGTTALLSLASFLGSRIVRALCGSRSSSDSSPGEPPLLRLVPFGHATLAFASAVL